MPRDKKTTNESSSSMDDKIKDLSKEFGGDFIKKGKIKTKQVSTGILTLDYLMQVGYRKRCSIMFYGPPECLKTTLGLKILANAQKRNEDCLVVNIEKGFDDERAEMLGLDMDDLSRIETPTYAEKYFEAICQSSLIYDFILVDSLASMSPREEYEKSLEENTARTPVAALFSKAFRKINSYNSNCAILYINQERKNPNAMGASKYPVGGEALKYYMDYSFEFKIDEYYDADKNEVSKDINQITHKPILWARVKLINKKNRRGERQKSAYLIVNMETGEIDLIYEIIMLAKELHIIETSGSWMTVPGCDGKMQQKTLMEWLDNKENFDNLKKLVVSKLEEI